MCQSANDPLLIARNTIEPEVTDLLEALYQEYGYDFRGYSKAHVFRRLNNRITLSNLKSISELKTKVLREPEFAARLVHDLSITVTEMFRDPGFYAMVREKVIPILRTYPYFKIWHAGCSTGEEVYSMAIVLKEEGLYDRVRIYATDFNQKALDQAREGIFSGEQMKLYTQNYHKSGGKESFALYYTSHYGNVIMDAGLKKNIVWANHNLVTDAVFSEVHIVVCRNVLIYFERKLQDQVHQLFYESLVNGGILCLGSKESLRFSQFANAYTSLDKNQRVFRKKYPSADTAL